MGERSQVGFVTMGDAVAADDIRTIGVGMLGYAFMGKAHSNAFRKIAYMTWPPPLMPRLVSICGRDEAAVAEAARRYGYDRHCSDWQQLLEDDDVELFDNGAPNHLHAEPTIAAARAGRHVVCEKPLGRDANESFRMWREVASTGVQHMCAFNYRFVPAVRLAREIIRAGDIGELHHFRATYRQSWITDPQFEKVWRLDRAAAGSGALGDLGTHAIDLARFLVGEITEVSALATTFVADRPGGAVDVDDAVESVVRFDNGAIGTIEATRFATGRKNAFTWEVSGSRGSIAFDMERLNELEVHIEGTTPAPSAQGFRRVLVTEADHPFWEHWWPHGHIIGWEHTFVHELHHLLSAIATDSSVAPLGATFEDGYRASEVADAMLRSATTGTRQSITYRSLDP